MGRPTWHGFTGAFVAAASVAIVSCSGGSSAVATADGSTGTDGGGQTAHDGSTHDGSGRDGSLHPGDATHDAPTIDTGCGGPCEAGAGCATGADCASGVCTGKTCAAPSPTDGVKNDSETGVDCGGGTLSNGTPNPVSDGAPACGDGKGCTLDTDCTSGSCQANTCVAATCADKILDGMETDIDCGGPTCLPCPTGDKCKGPTDCASDVCTNSVCIAPTDTDGVKNDSETDVDCGGGLLMGGAPNPASDGAPICATGKKCLIGPDCAQGVCAMGAVPIDGGVSDSGASDAGAGLFCQPASPTDGVQNDSETDVDCGGALLAGGATNPASDGAPACGAMKKCVLTLDCESFICTDNVCAAPSATDGVKNDSESDVDCGGGFLANGTANPMSDGAPACADAKACLLGTDCKDLVCFTGAITPATASTDGSPINCPAGSTCTCQPPSPSDGVPNDSETDVDCGGALLASGAANPASDKAAICAVGKKCQLASDCAQGVCNGTMGAGKGPASCPAGETDCTCQAAAPADGVKNDSETDVDCGGAFLASGAANPASDSAPGCGTGKVCVLGTDCGSLVCYTGVISSAIASANGSPINCPAGQTCTCQAPTAIDGVKNSGETGVDCGGGYLANGTLNPASDGALGCAADGAACVLNTDCLSDYCSKLSSTCVAAQSCAGLQASAGIMNVTGTNSDGDATGTANANGVGQHAGLDTCGRGEPTDPVAQQAHESCCKSLTLPGLATCSPTKACPTGETCVSGTCEMRLDKYEVTAGRMRQFVESVNAQMLADPVHNPDGYEFDIRDWATSQVAAGTPAGKILQAQIPADVFALLPQNFYGALNIVEQLGGTSMDANHPSASQGCYTGDGANGASTYYWIEDLKNGVGLAQVGSPARPYTQDYYDEKSMNCGTYWVYAAFCAWDGGYLPSIAQVEAAYGGSQYPWGGTFIPNYGGLGSEYVTAAGNPNIPQPAVANTVNWCNSSFANLPGNFYFYPNGGALGEIPAAVNSGLDYSPFIAAPGRFYLDATALLSPSKRACSNAAPCPLTEACVAGVCQDAWQDLGANMMEMTALANVNANNGEQFCDCGATNNGEVNNCTCPDPGTGSTKPGVIRATGLPDVQWSGGSWEGHSNNAQPEDRPYFAAATYGEAIQTQYGKAGFRCARAPEPW